MKKTKIICTMGPNTNDRELMKNLVENGMDIARFNFSHGDHAEQKARMDMLKSVREEAVNLANMKGFVETGDIVVVTAGIPATRNQSSREGMSNMMRIAIVE